MNRLLNVSTLEASNKVLALAALPLIHLTLVGAEKSKRKRESELPMTRPKSETNAFIIELWSVFATKIRFGTRRTWGTLLVAQLVEALR